MAELGVQKITLSGTSPTFAAADGAGDSFTNDGQSFLHVKNGDIVSHTITVDSQKLCNFGFDHDVSLTVTAGSEIQIGPFERSRFNDNNYVTYVSYDAVTSLSVAVSSIK